MVGWQNWEREIKVMTGDLEGSYLVGSDAV